MVAMINSGNAVGVFIGAWLLALRVCFVFLDAPRRCCRCWR